MLLSLPLLLGCRLQVGSPDIGADEGIAGGGEDVPGADLPHQLLLLLP